MEKPDESTTILVVDDEEEARITYSELITAFGIRCLTAATVDEAVLRLKQDPIALVLLDWKLTEPSGLTKFGSEVLQFCRKEMPEIVVIVMSGQSMDIQTDALLQDADGFLAKGGPTTVVRKHLERWLKRINTGRISFFPRSREDVQKLKDVQRQYVLKTLV